MKWMKFSPGNSNHKIELVNAELARVQGEYGRAREYYDEAIRLAHEHQFMNIEALAYELARHGIVSKDDLADQSIDELMVIEGMDEERAGKLIMTARSAWFETGDHTVKGL